MPTSEPACAPGACGRRPVLALVLAVVAAALWSGLAAGSARAASDAESLTLRLSDLAPGYLIGDDSGCGVGLAGEGAPRVLMRLGRRYRHSGCVIQFERLWAPIGESPGPPLIESTSFEFREEAGAVAGFAVARALAAYAVDVRRGSLDSRPATIPVGDSIAVFHTDDALVEGRAHRRGVIVFWRTGRVLSLVFVGGLAGTAGEERALALAQVQQGRIETPSPLLPGENDDRQVPLDNPQLGVPVYWLGPRLRPGGRFPTLVLADSFGPLDRRSGPGWRAEIGYRSDLRGAGVTLGLWRPQAFVRFKRTRLGRLVRTRRCTRTKRLELADRRAVIYGGYLKAPKRCRARAPDLYFAHVFFDGLVVTINIPICFLCVEPAGRRRTPYNTFAGMRTVIKAIHPRPPAG